MEAVMEQEAKSEREERADNGSGGGREGSEEEETSKADSRRVEQLSRFLRHQQEVVYK